MNYCGECLVRISNTEFDSDLELIKVLMDGAEKIAIHRKHITVTIDRTEGK